ncbi:type I inositol polyphosphate 5-phosphatase 2-like [Hibiscus syriacus]|uniref:type I inositol polyphosphate 5-phosphatase 2-like n=1 Tax=Hibiscus syriacus TaxID=106335 RepID=UPI001922A115|nr:type I inositol polyphosphate 5-phosphatase 2-like [Hibiscus syriacus]
MVLGVSFENCIPRVTIGTWNVAGRLPSEDLEIDDRLCTDDPADIYIIGYESNLRVLDLMNQCPPSFDVLQKLHNELSCRHVFDGWKEGVINFPPTYKYEIDSDRYAGEILREGEEKRCDRILWSGKGIKQLRYQRTELRLSDHQPVSSTFLLEVEVLDRRKLQRALNVSAAAVHPDILFDENEEFEL